MALRSILEINVVVHVEHAEYGTYMSSEPFVELLVLGPLDSI
jgi:hypothetical protein